MSAVLYYESCHAEAGLRIFALPKEGLVTDCPAKLSFGTVIELFGRGTKPSFLHYINSATVGPPPKLAM